MAYIDEYEQNLSELKKVQEDRVKQNIEAQRTEAQNLLKQEEEKIAPAYQKARTGVTTASKIQAKNIAEFLANRGQSKSGIASELEMRRESKLSGNITGLQTEEATAIKDIARKGTEINTALDRDLADKYAGIQSTYLADILKKRDEERIYQDRLAEQRRAEEFAQKQYADKLAQIAREEAFQREQYNYGKYQDSLSRADKLKEYNAIYGTEGGGNPLGNNPVTGNPATGTGGGVQITPSARKQFDFNDFDSNSVLKAIGPASIEGIWKAYDSGQIEVLAPGSKENPSEKIVIRKIVVPKATTPAPAPKQTAPNPVTPYTGGSIPLNNLNLTSPYKGF